MIIKNMNVENISAFTVDVEDGVSLAMRYDLSAESKQTKRVVTYTIKILELLDKYDTKGTFFVLGEVADEFPELIKEISLEGHELGVHGYHHLQFFKMTKDQAYQEINGAKKLIEDISGKKVYGHRAPAFSITPETNWGLDVIAEAGFIYDSSIMPINGKRYGWPGFNKNIQSILTKSGKNLIEAPLSTIKVLGQELPIGGGGYLRLFPYFFTEKAMNRIIRERPAIVYLHPYELDTTRYPDYYYERLSKVGFLKRNKMKSMWINRKTVFPKLELLLSRYTFEPLYEIIARTLTEEDYPYQISNS